MRPNIYARLQIPCYALMLVLCAIGFLLIFVFSLIELGFGILSFDMLIMIFWIKVINKRATIEEDKEQPKRKNKHSIYRKPNH